MGLLRDIGVKGAVLRVFKWSGIKSTVKRAEGGRGAITKMAAGPLVGVGARG